MKKELLVESAMFFIDLGFDCANHYENKEGISKKDARIEMKEALKKTIASKKNSILVARMEKIIKINDPRIDTAKKVQKMFTNKILIGFSWGIIASLFTIAIYLQF